MKLRRSHGLVVLVAVALAIAGFWAWNQRRGSTAEGLGAAASAAASSQTLELASSETITVAEHPLARIVPVSGTVKAVKTATVKVRVAGEIQGLSLREGDAVKAGQVVARIDPTEMQARLRQAREQADAAKAQVDIAQRQVDNNQSLVQQGFISKTALENALANLNGAKSTYQAANAAVDVVKRSLDDTVLRSPITGFVATRALQNGERAGIDAKVVDIVDVSVMELEAVLAPQDAAAVRVGQAAKVRLDGAIRESLAAKVVRVSPSTQTGSRGVLVFLSLEPHAALKHGLYAQGDVLVGLQQVLALPLATVRTDRPAPYVQWVNQGVVEHRAVTLGERGDVNGQPYVAVQGLSAGMRVVAGSVGPLRAGTPVRLDVPAATPANPVASPGASAALGVGK
jgi:multidrug efflux system membrane fusion protein